MPDSLLFGSTIDYRKFGKGTFIGTGAYSLAAIIKPSTADFSSGLSFILNFAQSASEVPASCFMMHPSGEIRIWDGTNEIASQIVMPAADEWYLVAVTKATGTVNARSHIYRYSTSSWIGHSNNLSANNELNSFAEFTHIVIPYSSGEEFDGNVLIAGVWDSQLSDGAVEGLAYQKNAWLSADEAWRFDTTGAITPLVGSGTQTAVGSGGSGTLDTGDAPEGWIDTPTRTGTASQINTATGSTGSVSVTVPTDATLAVLFMGHYEGSGSVLNTKTLGGNAFTNQAQVAPTPTTHGMLVATLENPPTGSQTFAWGWSGSSPSEGGTVIIVWVRDHNTTNPVRDVGIDGGYAVEATNVEVTIDTETTDLLLAHAHSPGGGAPVLAGTCFVNNLELGNSSIVDTSEVTPSAPTTTVTMTGEFYTSMGAISLPMAGEEPPEEEAPTFRLVPPMYF